MRAVNGTPLESPIEVFALLVKGGYRVGYCDPNLWPELEPHAPPEITVHTTFDRARVDDYTFGITEAAGAIAATGTLILTDRGTSSRLGALAPWVHVALVRRTQLYPDIASAVAALPKDPNVIWVTGPSKTADVEGILIEGVHGPGIQVALVR
jgi:L-lactate dehydrogenase complex protein LldG